MDIFVIFVSNFNEKIMTLFHFSPRIIRAKKIDFCLVGIYDNEGLTAGGVVTFTFTINSPMDCLYFQLFLLF